MTSAIQSALSKVPGVDPRVRQRLEAFSGLNDGPATTAARLTGLTQSEHAKDDSPYYTGNFGPPIPDVRHSLNIGGIPYQRDTLLLEKQQAFDRSKIQERIVHPAGSSAFGYFETTHDVSHLTKASLFQPGKKTPAYTRFSTVTYGREYPDSARNPRGFAVKFYTEDGNYDLVGLNFPIFFIRDPFIGPDNIRSQQRHPKNFLIDYNAWFDFLSNVPESIHAGTMLLSDHATPVGWRFFNAYGCHTFGWVNAANELVYVKYHWLCNNGDGPKQFTHEESIRMCGEDPDFAKRDLWEYIEEGSVAQWTLKVQVMKPEQIPGLVFDPFDVTKIWPRAQFPVQEVGKLVLNRNPEDYFRDVEQAAFSAGSLVPGIQLSPDTLLQWRAFFYRDAQYHRLQSANIHQIPVNCPFMAKYHSPDNYDGTMRTDANAGGKPYYFPNSYHNTMPVPVGTPGFLPSATEAPMQVGDNVVSRKGHYRHEGQPSEFDQVRELVTRVMTPEKKRNLFKNTATLLKFADKIVQRNYLAMLYAVHPTYAMGVMELLPTTEGLDLEEIKERAQRAHLVGLNPEFTLKDKGYQFMGMPVGRCKSARFSSCSVY